MRLAGCQPLVFDSFCNSGNTCLVFWRRESVLLPGASATTFLPLVPRGDPAAPENLRCEAYTKICVILSPDAMPVQRLCVRFHHTLKRKRAHETNMTRYNRRPACSQRPAKKTAARSEPVAACRFDVRRLGGLGTVATMWPGSKFMAVERGTRSACRAIRSSFNTFI